MNCNKHKKYRGIRRPSEGCLKCKLIRALRRIAAACGFDKPAVKPTGEPAKEGSVDNSYREALKAVLADNPYLEALKTGEPAKGEVAGIQSIVGRAAKEESLYQNFVFFGGQFHQETIGVRLLPDGEAPSVWFLRSLDDKTSFRYDLYGEGGLKCYSLSESSAEALENPLKLETKHFQRCLFIGGPVNLQIRSLALDSKEWLTGVCELTLPTEEDANFYRNYFYRMKTIATVNGVSSVGYVLDGMSDEAANEQYQCYLQHGPTDSGGKI